MIRKKELLKKIEYLTKWQREQDSRFDKNEKEIRELQEMVTLLCKDKITNMIGNFGKALGELFAEPKKKAQKCEKTGSKKCEKCGCTTETKKKINKKKGDNN